MLPEIPPSPKKSRPRRLREKRPDLTVEQILAWADAHHERTGQWPDQRSGRVAETLRENWCALNQALKSGHRGLPGGFTLAQLLHDQRGVCNGSPPVTVEQILAWADAHYQHTGEWPSDESGPVAGTLREHWAALNTALRQGYRGLPGGSSLARLLRARRGVCKAPPPLTVEQVLAWADAFFADKGRWPNHLDGPIAGSRGETWGAVESALQRGRRALPGGLSLARLLERERGVRNRKYPPPLTEEQILGWAGEHHHRTGRWPNQNSGPVAAAPGECWEALNQDLIGGFRSLPGGDSLAKLLARRLGVRNRTNLPPLSEAQILQWADTHRARTGRWPNGRSGVVAEDSQETWGAIDDALRKGRRRCPGGDSLLRLLTRHGRLPPGEGNRS